ncbi:MAG TPA: tripartite tricarboxylate transporter substrate binding protein [Burkholderiales bacterium]|nr:tripartite tricarboxylate transporter substrate binding protein [Burkholderiales bacterium]
MSRRVVRFAAGAAVFALALAFGGPAAAQGRYPARPIRILIPFPAAGAADTIGRTIGEQLSLQLGQPVVIDNRPGAAGRLATEMLARAEPDGYTLLVGGVGPLSISPGLYRKLPYDAARDFAPITRAAEIINVMVVSVASGVASPSQFIEWARQRKSDVRFGSSGPGQFDHLVGEFFQREAKIRMTHVPYKGGGPALVDMVSGDLQVMFATYVTAVPHIRGGRLRAIAVSTPQRQSILPDLPAVSETLPGFGASNWNGIFAPARTPRAIVDRLFAEIAKAMQHPEVKRRQNFVGIEPGGSASPAEFTRFIRDDTARWARIIKDAEIRIE